MDTTQTAPRIERLRQYLTIDVLWGLMYLVLPGLLALRFSEGTMGRIVDTIGVQGGHAYLLLMMAVGAYLIYRKQTPIQQFMVASLLFVVYIIATIPSNITATYALVDPMVIYMGLWVLAVYAKTMPPAPQQDTWLHPARLTGLINIAYGILIGLRYAPERLPASEVFVSLGIPIEAHAIIYVLAGIALFSRRWQYQILMLLNAPILFMSLYGALWFFNGSLLPLSPIFLRVWFVVSVAYVALEWSMRLWRLQFSHR